MKATIAAAIVLVFASAAAPAASASTKSAHPPRQCFYARNVDGFAAQSDRLVNVRVGVRDVYQFEMFGRCPEVRWHERLALVSRGSDWICSGLDAELITPSAIGPQRCPVSNIRKLTPAEIAALPKGARP